MPRAPVRSLITSQVLLSYYLIKRTKGQNSYIRIYKQDPITP
jgi:hypothetical protein